MLNTVNYGNKLPLPYNGNTNTNTNNFNFNFNYSNEEKYILDNALIFAKDTTGCRIVQKKLEEKKKDFSIKFFEKV